MPKRKRSKSPPKKEIRSLFSKKEEEKKKEKAKLEMANNVFDY